MLMFSARKLRCVAASIVVATCTACSPPAQSARSAGTAAPPPVAPQTCPILVRGRPQPPHSWQSAADGDVIELARLADREGALALVDGAARGGNAGRVALAALPYAPDAPLALEQLCSWLVQCPDPHDALLLSTLHQLLTRHTVEDRERLDVTGAQRCEQVLVELSGNDRSPRTRDLLSSALALVRERLRLPQAPN